MSHTSRTHAEWDSIRVFPYKKNTLKTVITSVVLQYCKERKDVYISKTEQQYSSTVVQHCIVVFSHVAHTTDRCALWRTQPLTLHENAILL